MHEPTPQWPLSLLRAKSLPSYTVMSIYDTALGAQHCGLVIELIRGNAVEQTYENILYNPVMRLFPMYLGVNRVKRYESVSLSGEP